MQQDIEKVSILKADAAEGPILNKFLEGCAKLFFQKGGNKKDDRISINPVVFFICKCPLY